MKKFSAWFCFGLVLLTACVSSQELTCELPCELGLAQTTRITVKDFVKLLTEKGWVQNDPERTFHATYARGRFSNVLETTTIIEFDGFHPEFSFTEAKLYIGNVGTVQLDHASIPNEEIELIQIATHMTLLESLLRYGVPEGGKIFPIYLKGDLNELNPCTDRSHYIAYYKEGKTIIRAEIRRPILMNMWLTPVEIVYPFGDDLDTTRRWLGKFQRMDHSPCMPD